MQISIIKKNIEKLIIPYYTELAFYSMSIALLLLIVTNVPFVVPHFYDDPSINRTKYQIFNLVFYFIIGLLLPIFHVFVKRKKSVLSILLFQIFSIIINTTACLYSFGYVYNTTKDWFYIFPLWNFMYAVVLPALFHYDLINLNPAFEKDASLKEVCISSLVLVVVFYVCQFYFNFYWGITFSICIMCSTNVTRMFGGSNIELDTI